MRRIGFAVPGTIFVLALRCLLSPVPVVGQQVVPKAEPIVVVTELSSPQGDVIAGKLASSITDTIDLILKMTGSMKVVRADFLLPTASFDRALEYYRQVGAERSVFGSVSAGHDGSYTIALQIWSASSTKSSPAKIDRTISDLLNSFSVADQLSIDVASTVVGRTLSEGTLIVRNTARLKSYSVYIDGHLTVRNQSTTRLLTGSHEVVVAKPGVIGDVPVQSFKVDIKKDQTVTVALGQTESPPPVVFVSGTANGDVPIYWRNGVAARLPTGGFANGARASTVIVDPAGGVHFGGQTGPLSSGLPVYWDKDAFHSLQQDSGASWGSVRSSAVDPSGNLFFVGSNGSVGAYWENGGLHLLPNGSGNIVGSASAIAVDGAGKVYVAGKVGFSSTTSVAWENGALTYLPTPNGGSESSTSGIAVDRSGNIYVSGSFLPSSSQSLKRAVLWKNGSPSTLEPSTPGVESEASAVATDRQGNVYVVGYEDNHPCFWKNGVLKRLPASAPGSGGRATGIALAPGGSIYISGWIVTGNGKTPVYWENGKLHKLQPPSGFEGAAIATSIALGSPEPPTSPGQPTGS
jgi:hypothetical protein